MDPHDKAILWGSKESDYRTPDDCYQALDREFDFGWDLAASSDNTKCGVYFFGPGSTYGENALTAPWSSIGSSAPKFLNPPFSKTLVNAYNTGRIKQLVKRPGQLVGTQEWVDHPIDREKAKSYDVESWAEKCWRESQLGVTIVGIFPFAPQTDWYRQYVYGHVLVPRDEWTWPFHAAREERRLPHRISFLTTEGEKIGNAGVNSVIVVWRPNHGIVGPWQPHQFYWSYREAA
jgi:hypothetical protein